jgi:hypothetical protein
VVLCQCDVWSDNIYSTAFSTEKNTSKEHILSTNRESLAKNSNNNSNNNNNNNERKGKNLEIISYREVKKMMEKQKEGKEERK